MSDASINQKGAYRNADFARHLSRVTRIATIEMGDLAYGMWNPNFCTADASDRALAVCRELGEQLRHIAILARRAQTVQRRTLAEPAP